MFRKEVFSVDARVEIRFSSDLPIVSTVSGGLSIEIANINLIALQLVRRSISHLADAI